jgi:hypothetical protein
VVFAVDEKGDLAKRFEVVFVFNANHGTRLDRALDLVARENCVISGGDRDIFSQ